MHARKARTMRAMTLPEHDASQTHRDALRHERDAQARAHAARAARVRRVSRALGFARLAIFAAGAYWSVRAAAGRDGAAAAAITWVVFALVVAVHRRVRARGETAAWAAQLARESAARLAGGRGPGVAVTLPAAPVSPLDAAAPVYRDDEPEHALSAWAIEDLGVDGGRTSLVALLDTTQTLFGARRLRRMLQRPLIDADAIRARQSAVAVLAAARDRRDALLLAFRAARGASLVRLPAFLAAPRLLHGHGIAVVAVVCAVAQIAALLSLRRFPQAVPVLAAAAATSFALHLALRQRIALLRDGYRELEPLVRVARGATQALAPATDAILGAAHGVLQRETREVSRIAAALRGLHIQDTGALYPILELVTSVELLSLCVLEAVVKRRGGGWERVAGALGDVEALAALAVDADERVPNAVADIVGGEPQIELVAGQHPLLDADKAVANDIHLGGDVRLALVTGSNMAGKSTFLRTVAANVILAQAGARVRARALRVTPLRVHAHIHVRDSLADGKSTFLVEVERVRAVLEAADRDRFVLGILDELFRGTNSIERIAAGRAIATHLAATGALFLVATHDPELAQLAVEGTVGTTAVHFGDEIVEGRMHFPYRLQPGQARTRNALRLLDIAGYPPALVRAARHDAATRGLDAPDETGIQG